MSEALLCEIKISFVVLARAPHKFETKLLQTEGWVWLM